MRKSVILMVGSTRKRHPDQMNLRLGAEFLQKFNDYMKGRSETKVQFIRAALEFWMSVDGNKENIRVHLDKQADRFITLQQERIDELRKYQEQCITYQRELIEEKDKQIRYLTEQLKKGSNGTSCYSDGVVEEAIVAEPKPVYYNPDTTTKK